MRVEKWQSILMDYLGREPHPSSSTVTPNLQDFYCDQYDFNSLAPSEKRLCATLGMDVVSRHIIVVAPKDSLLFDHSEWLEICTQGLTIVSSLQKVTDLLVRKADCNFLIVDIAIFESTDVAVDDLILFRQKLPNMPLVAASVEFGFHDLSRIRTAIADASVRLPVSRPELALALSVGYSNNRLSQLHG